jgi:hypothetical protein
MKYTELWAWEYLSTYIFMVHKFNIVYLYRNEKSCNIDGEENDYNVKTTKWNARVYQIMYTVFLLMLVCSVMSL